MRQHGIGCPKRKLGETLPRQRGNSGYNHIKAGRRRRWSLKYLKWGKKRAREQVGMKGEEGGGRCFALPKAHKSEERAEGGGEDTRADRDGELKNRGLLIVLLISRR